MAKTAAVNVLVSDVEEVVALLNAVRAVMKTWASGEAIGPDDDVARELKAAAVLLEMARADHQHREETRADGR